jgi:hypothetical protein
MLTRGRKDSMMGLFGFLLSLYAAAQIVGVVNGFGAWAAYTPYPDGQSCVNNSECASTYCVDSVCCMDPACPPSESCNVQGHAGMCTRLSPAPALSAWAQLFVGTALLVFAWRRLSAKSRAR